MTTPTPDKQTPDPLTDLIAAHQDRDSIWLDKQGCKCGWTPDRAAVLDKSASFATQHAAHVASVIRAAQDEDSGWAPSQKCLAPMTGALWCTRATGHVGPHGYDHPSRATDPPRAACSGHLADGWPCPEPPEADGLCAECRDAARADLAARAAQDEDNAHHDARPHDDMTCPIGCGHMTQASETRPIADHDWHAVADEQCRKCDLRHVAHPDHPLHAAYMTPLGAGSPPVGIVPPPGVETADHGAATPLAPHPADPVPEPPEYVTNPHQRNAWRAGWHAGAAHHDTRPGREQIAATVLDADNGFWSGDGEEANAAAQRWALHLADAVLALLGPTPVPDVTFDSPITVAGVPAENRRTTPGRHPDGPGSPEHPTRRHTDGPDGPGPATRPLWERR